MHVSPSSKRFRKIGFRLFCGATIVLTVAAAEAQLDQGWLEHALQSAQQVTSPWPVNLDVPENDTRQQPIPLLKEAAPTLSPPPLDVKAVDTFDDPWASQPKLSVHAKENLSASAHELVDPWAEDLDMSGSAETLAHRVSYENIDLVDPWE